MRIVPEENAEKRNRIHEHFVAQPEVQVTDLLRASSIDTAVPESLATCEQTEFLRSINPVHALSVLVLFRMGLRHRFRWGR